MTIKIDRSYQDAGSKAPFLQMKTDEPSEVSLYIDCVTQDVWVQIDAEESMGPPIDPETFEPMDTEGIDKDRLHQFPMSPLLTQQGLDQFFDHPIVLKAIETIAKGRDALSGLKGIKGRRDVQDAMILLRELSESDLWTQFDQVSLQAPHEFFADTALGDLLQDDEPTEAAAERLHEAALDDGVWMSKLDIEFYLEDRIEDEMEA